MIESHKVSALVVAVIAALGTGCDDDQAVEPSVVRSELAQEHTESAEKRAWVANAGVERVDVDWDDVHAQPQLDTSRLSAEAQARLKDVDVPALLPDVSFVSTAFVSTGPTWYSAKMNGDAHSVYIMGNRGAETHEMGLTEEQKKSVKNFTVYRTHQIVTLAFNTFGVAYTIDVECEAPMTDKRCTEDAYVLDLAEKLVVAGGAR